MTSCGLLVVILHLLHLSEIGINGVARYLQYWKRRFASGLQLRELCAAQYSGMLMFMVMFMVFVTFIE